MKQKTGIACLYLMGLIQGISFTLIPGASAFLISNRGFHLTPQSYGQLFIPMIVMSILTSLLGGAAANKWGIRRVSVASGLMNFLSMAVFALCALYMAQGFYLLSLSLFFLGAGFGANLTTLNSYALEFFPVRTSAALTGLHAMLGIGTAIGPLFFQLALSKMQWWAAPLILAIAYAFLIPLAQFSFPVRLRLPQNAKGALAKGVWLFAAIALLYGICETAFGNWGILFLKKERGFSTDMAALSLSLYWGSVTLGRLLFAIAAIRISPFFLYAAIGPILIASLLLLDLSQLVFAAFILAGLGSSAFLPLTMSLGQKQDLPHAEIVSGVLMAVYMGGYGLTAYGIGWLQSALHFSLSALFLWLLIPAAILSFCAIIAGQIAPGKKRSHLFQKFFW